MHTAEHVLNQTMVRKFGCDRSFTNHIERKKSKCDYHFTTSPTEAEIREVEQDVNQVLQQHLPVEEDYVPREEAADRFDLSNLPEEAGTQIRIIRVGDYDQCLCSGPHVNNTSEIGHFRITTWSWENGVLRIRFKLNRS